jgi:hypothetical protein
MPRRELIPAGAKPAGLAVPPILLVQADEVIE